MSSFERELRLLVLNYPGKSLLRVSEVAQVFGVAPKTLYNQISKGDTPVPVVRVRGKPLFKVTDIAYHLAALGNGDPGGEP